MTVHNSGDAQRADLTAEMMTIGTAAREAARAMREASSEVKTRALTVAAAAIRHTSAVSFVGISGSFSRRYRRRGACWEALRED